MTPEQRLARAVLVKAWEDWTRPTLPKAWARTAEAGRFLWTRTDPVTRLWFTVAGVDMGACRTRAAAEVRHLPEVERYAAEEQRRSVARMTMNLSKAHRWPKATQKTPHEPA